MDEEISRDEADERRWQLHREQWQAFAHAVLIGAPAAGVSTAGMGTAGASVADMPATGTSIAGASAAGVTAPGTMGGRAGRGSEAHLAHAYERAERDSGSAVDMELEEEGSSAIEAIEPSPPSRAEPSGEGEAVGEAVGEAAGEAVGEAAGEAVGEAVGEGAGEAAGGLMMDGFCEPCDDPGSGATGEDDDLSAAEAASRAIYRVDRGEREGGGLVISAAYAAALSAAVRVEPPQSLRESAEHGVVVKAHVISAHLYAQLCYDVRYTLNHAPLAAQLLRQSELLPLLLRSISLVQGIQTLRRRTQVHVVREDHTWQDAFSLVCEMAHLFPCILAGVAGGGDGEAEGASQLRRMPSVTHGICAADAATLKREAMARYVAAVTHTLRATETWLASQRARRLGREGTRGGYTYHLSLHRAISALLSFGATEIELELEELLPPATENGPLGADFVAKLAVHPLRIQSLVAQTRAGWWVRNSHGALDRLSPIHPSPIAHHPSPITHHPSPITHPPIHPSTHPPTTHPPITHHPLPIHRSPIHPSPITHHLSTHHPSPTTHHPPPIHPSTHHPSPITHHPPPITDHLSTHHPSRITYPPITHHLSLPRCTQAGGALPLTNVWRRVHDA